MVTTVQQAIADHFLEQARWRSKKAAEYPEDRRNERCADGLEELAEYVLELPSDDPRIVAVDLICNADGVFVFHTEQGDHRGASYFRFHDGCQDCESFLTAWVDALWRGREELRTLAGA
jgi:hypothetical protein